MARPERKDYLTGFSLRESFTFFSRELLQDTKSKDGHFSIVLIDLDHFKKFNDTCGHPFGDEILKYAAENMRLVFPQNSATIFRYGGDEFVVILPDALPKEALYLVELFRHTLTHSPYSYKNKSYKLSISCGIAGFPGDGVTIEQLFKKADEALYYSKRCGRNRVTLAGRMNTSRFRSLLLVLAGILTIIGLGFILYQSALKGPLQHTLYAIKGIRFSASPKKPLDVITLKKGAVFSGKIREETNDRILLDVYLKKGSASLWLQKSNIANVKYGSNIHTKKK